MLLVKEEFAEKVLKKYINEELWLSCTLADYYIYLEYYDEGGYGLIYKVMDRISGEHLILKKSSKKDFVSGSLQDDKVSQKWVAKVNHSPNHPDGLRLVIEGSCLKISKEAEFMVKIHKKLGGIKLYDYYDDEDHYILVMEYGGRSLENIVCSHKKKIVELLRYDNYRSNYFYKLYLTQIIEWLKKTYFKIKDVHDLGIHHNDLKPENILVKEGDVVIIDYGVAKHVEPYYVHYKGTLEYIPYEYAMFGSYNPWDHTIWCFGIMLHFMGLMKYPFLSEEDVIEYELDYQQINKLPPSFSALIYDCLNKDPLKRPVDLLDRIQNLRSY